jgi:hypothetical protein
MQLFHGAPDPASGVADIYVRLGDESILVADDFEFRRYSSFLAVPAEVSWDLLVASGASNIDGTLQSDEILATAVDIELEANTNNLAIAHGVLEPTGSQLPPFDVTVRRDLLTTPGQDAVNGLFFHASPGLPVVDMSPSNAYDAWVLFDDIGYGSFSEEVEQFSQPDIFELYSPDGTFVTNFQPPLGVEPTFGGGVLTGAATGYPIPTSSQTPAFRLAVFSNNPSVVGMTAFEDLPVRTGQPATLLQAGARVRFVHVASAQGFETVDLEIGAEPETVSDLGFSEASEFLSLPAGTTISVDITGAETSVQRKFTVSLPDSGIPKTRTVFFAGNGQTQPVQLRPANTVETERFSYRDDDPDDLEFDIFHGATTESFATVDILFADDADRTLRGPVSLEYGNVFSGEVGPAAELASMNVQRGQSVVEFDIRAIADGSYATIYLADAPTALGLRAYALVDGGDPVELPRE